MLTAGTPAGGGRRTPADGGRADTPAGGGKAVRRTPRQALRYRGECMLMLWEREDTEGAPSGRQGRYTNK